MRVVLFLLSAGLLLSLSACADNGPKCPVVSQWWYHACPDTPQKIWNTRMRSGSIGHNPSTVTSLGGRGRGR